MTLVEPYIARQFERLPPHDIDAEKCVLASMMLDRETIPSVRSLLGRDAWFQADHEVIAGVLYDMHDEGKAIDAIILRAELHRRGLLEEVGGNSYLGDILNTVPSSVHVDHYAGIVKESAMWRELIAMCNEAQRAAYAARGGKFMEPAATELAKLSARAVKAAAGGKLAQVHSLTEVAFEVAEQLEAASKGADRGQFIRTGLWELDGFIGGIRRRGTTLVGAKPGMGKSALIKQILDNIARGGIAVGLITVEEDRYKVAGNRLASESGVANNRIAHAKTSADERRRVATAAANLPPKFFILDVARKLTEIVAAAHLLATKHRCQAIAVDHVHIIDGEPEGRENREREISRISATLKNTWKELNVAGIEACQLNRGSGSERPTMANLRDSGSLEADGDVILLLHREDYYRKKQWKPGDAPPDFDEVLEVIVGKNKDGAEGTVKTHFDEATQTVRDLQNEPAEDPFA